MAAACSWFNPHRSTLMSSFLRATSLDYVLPDGTSLFSDLSFHLGTGRTGLVGRNGVGKTTLFEILAGIRPPSSGQVIRNGRIGYLPQTHVFAPDAIVTDALGITPPWTALQRIDRGEADLHHYDLASDHWDLPARLDATLSQLGIEYIQPERRLDTLSGGEVMRVRLAGLLIHDPDILLLDEPTNHLDVDARQFVHDFVAGWGRTLLVVSHDRTLLNLVDRIAELTPKGIREYGGGFAFYEAQRQTELDAARRTAAEAEKQLRDAERTAREARERQAKRASTGRRHGRDTGMGKYAAGIHKEAAERTTRRIGRHHERIVDHAAEVQSRAEEQLPEDRQINIDLEPGGVPRGKRIVEAFDLRYRFHNSTSDIWPEPLSFTILGGERVALLGPNGSGKTTIVDLIRGSRRPTEGSLYVGTARIAVLDQQTNDLDDDATLLENLQNVAPSRPEHELRILLGRFLFPHESVFKPVRVLSGGERIRAGLVLALAADQAPDLLILDEPTNNLDLESLEEVVSALQRYLGTLIVISHDVEFLRDVGIERQIDLPFDKRLSMPRKSQ